MRSVPILAFLTLALPSFAQQAVTRSFQRVTAPIRDAGVYHVATGTWTRSAETAPTSLPIACDSIDTVYACTSPAGYFAELDPGQTWSASGRIPSGSAQRSLWNPAAIPLGSQLGVQQSCGHDVEIEGFRIGYCTDQSGSALQATLAFFESWNPPCTTTLSASTPQGGPLALSGLPGRGTGSLACWTVTIDLTGSTSTFFMLADGNGTADGADAFGWTISFPSITSTLARTGPLLAGAPSDSSGPGSACHPPHPGVGWAQFPPSRSDEAAGYDGRRIDDPMGILGACAPTYPANSSSFTWPGTTSAVESGSDMLGRDGLRIEGGTTPPPGCYRLGMPSGNRVLGPYANFFLELYARVVCVKWPLWEYCAGDGLSVPPSTPCPCGNFGAAGNGCASSFNPAGAHLGLTGRTECDRAVLRGSGMQSTGICIFLKGNASDGNGFRFGDGITCTGGSLIRMRAVALAGGMAAFPVPPETITLSERGGNTLGSGQLVSYAVFYRNSADAFCPPFTFNATNNIMISW